jgi:Holliday junction resolvase RusA-like endonuclease
MQITEEIPTQTIQLRPFFTGTVPVPPSVNAAYQIVQMREGSRVTGVRIGSTDALEQFKKDAALMLTQGYHNWSLINAIRQSKIKTPLVVRLQAYFSSEWKRDLDGIIKYTIDAAFERLELNDNLVVKVEAEKLVDPREPRVEIEIRCVVGR